MNEQWLKQLYDANYDMLYRLASNRLRAKMGHSSDAQDVLQEVFLLAFKKEIDRHPNPEGWLVITTVNICRNVIQANARRLRKNSKCARALQDKNLKTNVDETEFTDIRVSIEQSLSQEEYALLIDYCEGKRTLDMLAKDMNLSVNALRVRIFRIRKKIRNLLD